MAGPLGSAPGIIVGVGVGTAAAAAIEPAVELPRQKAWAANAVRVLDPAVMARLVASGGVDLGTAQTDGELEGYGADKVNALVYLAQTVPGFAEAVTGLRRKTISPGDFAHTLVKSSMDARYFTAIEDLANTWLTPAQVALAIVRSLIADPGLMPVNLDTSGGNVPAYPQANIDALVEAAGGGVDRERLRVMVGSIGLPMSTQQAANATFRGITTRGDFNRSILEGDVRPEWADAIFEQARQILTASEYAELELRGYYQRPTRLANTQKHGMTDADSDLLFEVLGRGLSLHQMVIGKARGGVYGFNNPAIPADELASMQRGNLRPEYYDIAWHGRYGYPTGFQIKAEATAGNLSPAQTDQILLELGWDPKWATHFSQAWTGGGTTATKQKKQTLSHLLAEYLSGALTAPALTTILTTTLGYSAQQAADEIALAEFKQAASARTRAIRALEKRFVAVQLSDADARTALGQLGLPAGAIEQHIVAWVEERLDTLTTLTVAQVQKAYKKGVLSAAVATTLLQELGEDAQAIQAILASA